MWFEYPPFDLLVYIASLSDQLFAVGIVEENIAR